MPKIKLTLKEVDHLRSYYEYELTEAIQYIKQLKSIISKLDTADRPTVVKPIPAAKVKPKAIGKKRGRPAKPITEKTVKVEEPKPKAKRGRPKKVKVVEPNMVAPEVPPIIQADKPVVVMAPEKPIVAAPPKPKRKRISNYRRKGVYLTNWSKPLPKKPKEDAPDSTTDLT